MGSHRTQQSMASLILKGLVPSNLVLHSRPTQLEYRAPCVQSLCCTNATSLSPNRKTSACRKHFQKCVPSAKPMPRSQRYFNCRRGGLSELVGSSVSWPVSPAPRPALRCSRAAVRVLSSFLSASKSGTSRSNRPLRPSRTAPSRVHQNATFIIAFVIERSKIWLCHRGDVSPIILVLHLFRKG